jgi:hypothetical protein
VLVTTGDDLTWWTFAGGRATLALAAELSYRLGVRATGDNFAVRFGTPPDVGAVRQVITALRADHALQTVVPVDDAARDSLKFSECLSPALANQVVRARLSDRRGVIETLALPTRVIAIAAGNGPPIGADLR